MKNPPETPTNLVDLDFMDARARLLDVASFLDRVERAGQEDDYRVRALREAAALLDGTSPDRATRILELLSDPSREPIPEAHTQGAAGAFEGGRMKYIEPHAHMVSRTTADYEAMALAGCQAISEPAFWAGYDRSSEQGFYDYFDHLTGFEPKRAAQFGIAHYTWMCINPKEAEDMGLARAVLALIPEFLQRDTVLGIGEIGLNKNSRNELQVLEEHIQLAADHDQLILVHTPHLEDKLKGTRLIIDALKNHSRIDPERVIIDHVEEHTVGVVKDAGFWAGMTLYPESKLTARRAVDIVEMHGTEKIWMNCACDWGVSDPLATPRAARLMAQRGHSEAVIDQVFFQNPATFMGQSPRFTL